MIPKYLPYVVEKVIVSRGVPLEKFCDAVVAQRIFRKIIDKMITLYKMIQYILKKYTQKVHITFLWLGVRTFHKLWCNPRMFRTIEFFLFLS